LIAAPERLAQFPESGRIVPELGRQDVREVLWRSYRIVYQFVPAADQVRILTVFRGERLFQPSVVPE
jgi:plasmid stabilization system protein ParE